MQVLHFDFRAGCACRSRSHCVVLRPSFGPAAKQQLLHYSKLVEYSSKNQAAVNTDHNIKLGVRHIIVALTDTYSSQDRGCAHNVSLCLCHQASMFEHIEGDEISAVRAERNEGHHPCHAVVVGDANWDSDSRPDSAPAEVKPMLKKDFARHPGEDRAVVLLLVLRHRHQEVGRTIHACRAHVIRPCRNANH